jgi:hypothetical protein
MRQSSRTVRALRTVALSLLLTLPFTGAALPQSAPTLWGTVFHVDASGHYFTRTGDQVFLYVSASAQHWIGPFYTNDGGVYTIVTALPPRYEVHVFVRTEEVASRSGAPAGHQDPIYLPAGK